MAIGNRKATVSLLLIVRNEEKQLADCLEPIAALFDEIVIVDTGSQDGTKQVAARYTDRLFDFPWCDDFSAARNECLRHATGDWVLWLDADDRLTAENVERLRRLLSTLDDASRAYLMNTACWSEYACEGYTLISHPRLFRRDFDLRWEGRVHEQLRSASSRTPIDVVFSDVQVDHHGYRQQAMHQWKLQRNLRLLRMDYAVKPDDASTLLHLGLTHYQLGQWSDAEPILARLLDISSGAGEHLRQVHGALSHMAIKRGDMGEALRRLERGLLSFPSDEYLLYLRAECLYDLDRFDDAINTLIQIVAAPERAVYAGGSPGEIRTRLAPRKLADTLRLKRQFAAASSLLRTLLARFPQDTHSWHTLGRVYLDAGRKEPLFSVVEQLRQCPQGEIFADLLLGLWHLNNNDLDSAAERINLLIARAPQMPLARVLRFHLLARSGAPLAARIQACRDVLRVQPGNIEARDVLQALEADQQSHVAGPVSLGSAVSSAAAVSAS